MSAPALCRKLGNEFLQDVRAVSPCCLALVLVGGCVSGAMGAETPTSRAAATVRVYARLLEPQEHPDYDRRHVRPPGWDTFGRRTRFTSLRGFNVADGQIVNYVEEIEKYTRTHELGDVLWPSYPILFGRNLGDLADEIKRRDLFLFDIWGYVPGSGPGGYWQQFRPPPGVFEMLESRLGPRWLGMDVGEQDGRYIGGYAPEMYPSSADRFEQYLNFQRHFQRMCDDLGNKMSTLVSLNFGHYFLREGVYTLIGAETAQALPNGQVYYAFIRGAGKQYGVPWFGNASVFNRWGYKTYGSQGPDHGPTLGTSLSLMKRLMYSHILYNCVFVGFESGWFDGEKLSPIGRIQQAAGRWIRQHGQPGVMLTPVAIMTDFLAGWSFPRHLYTGNVYRVWGNLPYQPGDYLTDGVLDMLYPRYQDSSYSHDESGFISPTPYGDSADCILSDAPAWLLDRYPVLVIGGELTGGEEIRDKLAGYVQAGGKLLITAGSLARLPGGLAGVQVNGPPRRLSPGQSVQIGRTTVTEDKPLFLHPLILSGQSRVLATSGTMPAAVETPLGKGSVTVLASPFGLWSEAASDGPISNDVDKPLAKPFPLMKHVRLVLDGVFRGQCLFEVGKDLSLITCRKGPREYTLGICNNSLQEKPFRITSLRGPIESAQELPLDQSEKEAVGYLPQGFENASVGQSGDGRIAGGDVRVFSVRLRTEDVEEIPHVAPPARPRGRVMPLRGRRPIKEEVLRRPTFFEHFDGVAVDWKYLRERDRTAIAQEAGWIHRQGLRVIVDLSSGINLYPDLRLVNNIPEDHASSMAAINDVLGKMQILDARDLVLSLHRQPENNFTNEQTNASFESTLRQVCQDAESHHVTVHLRLGHDKTPTNLEWAVQFMQRVGSKNLRLAPAVAVLLAQGREPRSVADLLREKVGVWLVSAPRVDVTGRLWTVHAPIAGYDRADEVGRFLALTPSAPAMLDAVYENQDEEYLDARRLDRLAQDGRGRQPATSPHE